jgi:hypothetical protein
MRTPKHVHGPRTGSAIASRSDAVSITRFITALALALLVHALIPERVDARGLRGGGGGGRSISRPAARPSISRPATRPSVSRPSPSQRPSSGWNLDSSNFQSHTPANRTPSMARPETRPAGGLTADRSAARDRAMANPQLKPLFDGDPSARRDAGRDRMQDAMQRTPNTDPAAARRAADRSQIAEARAATRTRWGSTVRRNIEPFRRTTFNRPWFDKRVGLFPQRWFYWHRPHPWRHWWRWFSWGTLNTWIIYDWNDPWFYDFDVNVYYNDEVVYVDDEPVSAYEDWVAGALALANAEHPPDDAETDWESFGTWTLSTTPDDPNPRMMVQLVLSREGLVSGSYYHTNTDNTQQIQGSIDKETQRLAFRIGGQESLILETGLANLEQAEASVWVHFLEEQKAQAWLLVRLDAPEEEI